MSLMSKVIGTLKAPLVKPPKEFISFFHAMEREIDFPFTLAINDLNTLEEQCHDENDFINFALDDIVYTSINATFFEELFVVIKENPTLGSQLIDKFSEKTEKREAMVILQANAHTQYIKNGGVCNGCDYCEYHKDVQELVPRFQNNEIDFFLNMYVGMLTIQYTFEQVLYDLLTVNPSYFNSLSRENIMAFRQYLFSFSEKNV